MRESDEQFLERFEAEIEPVIQPRGRITGLRLVEEAAAGFEARIAEARLALAFREVARA